MRHLFNCIDVMAVLPTGFGKSLIFQMFVIMRQRGGVVRALGLHAGSNPVLTSGLDLFPVVPDSALPRLVNSQLVASFQLEFLKMFLLSLNCFFHIVKSGVPVN